MKNIILRLAFLTLIAIAFQACSSHGHKHNDHMHKGKKSDCTYHKMKKKCMGGCSKSCSKAKEYEEKYSCEGESCGCEDKESCGCGSDDKTCGCKDKKSCGCTKKSCGSK